MAGVWSSVRAKRGWQAVALPSVVRQSGSSKFVAVPWAPGRPRARLVVAALTRSRMSLTPEPHEDDLSALHLVNNEHEHEHPHGSWPPSPVRSAHV
jgi:hypothetical protein